MRQSVFCNTFPLSVNILVSMPSWNKTSRQTLQQQAKKKKKKGHSNNRVCAVLGSERKRKGDVQILLGLVNQKQIKSAWRVIKVSSQFGFNTLRAAIIALASIFDCVFIIFRIILSFCVSHAISHVPADLLRTCLEHTFTQSTFSCGILMTSYRNVQSIMVRAGPFYFDLTICMTHTVLLNIINCKHFDKCVYKQWHAFVFT